MKFTKFILTAIIFTMLLFYACKDKSNDPTPDTSALCNSKSIIVSAIVTAANACMANGKLVARAKGSSGFTFQLNNGAFQLDSNFSNLASGNYSITAKDVDGCTKTETFIVANNNLKGPNFTAVAAIVAANCQGSFCHGTGNNNAPKNIMDTDCKIVNLGPTIKIKAVDDIMGNLSTTDKNKITAWLAAGGKFTD